MARPREFEIDAAVEGAMRVFWARGYSGAALPDLLDGMGIARGSLYKAFGEKRALFLQVLALYDRREVSPAIALLGDASQGGGDERIARVFTSVVQDVARGDRRGCLMCHTTADPGNEDAQIRKAVLAMVGRLTAGFAVALADAGERAGAKGPGVQGRGVQGPGVQGRGNRISDGAEALTAAYVALQQLARAGQPLEALESAVRGTLAAHLPASLSDDRRR